MPVDSYDIYCQDVLEVALEIFLAAQPDYNDNATPTLHRQGSGHTRPGCVRNACCFLKRNEG